MNHKIAIYAPNISRENLVALIYLGLGEHHSRIQVDVLEKSNAYRAAQLSATLIAPCKGSIQQFLMQIFQVGKRLGGTRFVFKTEETAVAEVDANLNTVAAADIFRDLPIAQVSRIDIF